MPTQAQPIVGPSISGKEELQSSLHIRSSKPGFGASPLSRHVSPLFPRKDTRFKMPPLYSLARTNDKQKHADSHLSWA
eukprot:255457-Pelagomonas_calceolata.AAC.2